MIAGEEGRRVLQAAFDGLTLDEALRAAEAAAPYADILEIGTPLIVLEGIRAVRAFRRAFPDKTLLADIKVMDGGALQAAYCFDAGASVITVLAGAGEATIRCCRERAAESGGDVAADLTNTEALPAAVGRLVRLGIRHLIVHRSLDRIRAEGGSSLEDLKIVKAAADALPGLSPALRLYAAGGITSETAGAYTAAGADGLIVGSALLGAPDIAAEAAKLRAVLDS